MRPLLAVFLATTALPAFADTLPATSTITAVTVYPEGAKLTREVRFTVPAEGAHELLVTDLLHGLSFNPLMPVYRDPEPLEVTGERALTFTRHGGGLVEIGHDANGFAYDCEGPRHRVWLDPFEIADRPVTNRDWIAFMQDGGYDAAPLWLSDGWAWVWTISTSTPANRAASPSCPPPARMMMASRNM